MSAKATNGSRLPNAWKPVALVSLVGLYVALAMAAVFKMLDKPAAGADDAAIFLVYARNFVHGHGIVYSSVSGHVEGFTSFLYFVVCSVCIVVTSHPERLLLVLNYLFAIASISMVLGILLRLCRAVAAGVATRMLLLAALLAWVCSDPAYFVWAGVSLMDGGLYGLLVTAALAVCVETIFAERPAPSLRNAANVLACLLVLVRPEGLVWAVVMLGSLQFLAPQSASRKTFQRSWWMLGGTLAVLTAWRMAYFGYPLPNTYYAKVSSSAAATLRDGASYLHDFFTMYGAAAALPVLAAIALAALGIGARRTQTERSGLAIATFTAIAYLLPLSEGGDHFSCFRLLQPAYPLLGLCVLAAITLLTPSRRFVIVLSCVVVAAALLGFTSSMTWRAFAANNIPDQIGGDLRFTVQNEFEIAERERINGEHLSDIFSGDLPTIGFGAAGGIALGYAGPVIDMMGLNDVRMAHARGLKQGPKGHQSFDPATFFTMNPDILLPNTALENAAPSLADVSQYYTDASGWDNLIFKDIFNDPAFRQRYRLATVWNRARPAYICFGYFNRQYLARAVASGRVQMISALP